MGIIITVLICATVFTLFYMDKIKVNINIKHNHTTEVSQSFREYQEFIAKQHAAEKENTEEDEVATLDDVVGVIKEMWEGVDMDD